MEASCSSGRILLHLLDSPHSVNAVGTINKTKKKEEKKAQTLGSMILRRLVEMFLSSAISLENHVATPKKWYGHTTFLLNYQAKS